MDGPHLPAAASRGLNPVLLVPLSFPHTAAGQFRIHTGIPSCDLQERFLVLVEKPMRGQNYHPNAQTSCVD